MKGQRFFLLALVGVVSFLSGGWLLQRGASQAGNVYQQARLFDDVLGYVELAETFADASFGFACGEQAASPVTGNYGGLGIRIDVRDGWITVIAPIAETPADDAGLETGDRIIAVDGRSTYGWKSDKAVSELRGEAGSEVTITVARPGMPEPMDVTVERAIIHVKAIQLATLLDSDVGYVSMVNASVSETLADELVEAVDSLRDAGATSLVLDLRYNPGGLLDQGVEVTDLFLDPGATVVSTRGRARGALRATVAGSPDRRARQRGHRERRGDHGRRTPGPRPRPDPRHADVRQGARADGVPPRPDGGAAAHDGAMVHAKWPADSEAHDGGAADGRRVR